MENKVTISELAGALAAKKGISKKDAETFVRTVFDIVATNLKDEKSIKIKGFGTFKLVEIKSRESINVNTGERILLNGYTKINFTPDAEMRDTVNKPFAQFETVILNEGTSVEEMERIFEPTVEVSDAEPVTQTEESTTVEDINEEKVEDHDVVSEEIVQNDNTDTTEETTVEEPAQVTEEVVTPVVNEETVVKKEVEIQETTQNNECKEKKKGNKFSKFLLLLIILAALAGVYYLKIHPEKCADNCTTTTVTDETLAVAADSTTTEDVVAPADTIANDTVVTLQEVVQQETYQQMVNGEFIIVGTKTEHVLRNGETLRTISLKYYGTKEYSDYIVIHNNIEKPDLVPVGMTLKIPELKTK